MEFRCMLERFLGTGGTRLAAIVGAPAALALAVTAHAIAIPGGDPVAGSAISQTCAACHGTDGNSQNPDWPSLAGQHEVYLANQLMSYRTEERQDPLMDGALQGFSEEDFWHLAAYYAELPLQARAAGAGDLTLGERLYRGGNEATGVSACIACHGPRGLGNPLSGYPRISGQHQNYLYQTLLDYANGERRSDAQFQGMMRDIAQRMSDEEMRAVAAYMQGLQ
jgi:cytochrome c553